MFKRLCAVSSGALLAVRPPRAAWGRPLGGARSSCQEAGASTPVSVRLDRRAGVLSVAFDDGARFTYPAEYLRVRSPSADAKSKRAQVVAGRRHVGIMGLESVGNYAVRLQFDDLHASGIYTWPYLYDLGVNKRRYMKDYIRDLRRCALSRNPQRNGRKKPGT